MSRGLVLIDVWDELSIDFGWKVSVDERVASVDGGEQVLVDEISIWVDGGWWISIDEITLMSIDEERLPLWIERSKFAGSYEKSSCVSLSLLVLLGMHLKKKEIFFCVTAYI